MCSAFFFTLFCLKGKSLLILFLCLVFTVPGSIHLLQRVCFRSLLCCQIPFPAAPSSSSVSQLTSVGEHPSHAQAHLSSHPSKMSGGDTKSAWHEHRGGSQCKRQRTLSHLSSRDERHLEWGVRGLHQQPQIQGGAWTFSCHPRLCETQAPILQDPAPQRASGQVMPCL